jgi:hypothetical protein
VPVGAQHEVLIDLIAKRLDAAKTLADNYTGMPLG